MELKNSTNYSLKFNEKRFSDIDVFTGNDKRIVYKIENSKTYVRQ